MSQESKEPYLIRESLIDESGLISSYVHEKYNQMHTIHNWNNAQLYNYMSYTKNGGYINIR